jgi:hypothetical protein
MARKQSSGYDDEYSMESLEYLTKCKGVPKKVRLQLCHRNTTFRLSSSPMDFVQLTSRSIDCVLESMYVSGLQDPAHHCLRYLSTYWLPFDSN